MLQAKRGLGLRVGDSRWRSSKGLSSCMGSSRQPSQKLQSSGKNSRQTAGRQWLQDCELLRGELLAEVAAGRQEAQHLKQWGMAVVPQLD